MAAALTTNREMFWRILQRLLFAHRGRLFVILLALGAGAAVTAALLNLQVDAKRRLTTEFRAFGSNVVIAPRKDASSTSIENTTSITNTLDESLLEQVPEVNEGNKVVKIGFLYLIANVFAPASNANSEEALKPTPAVVVGYTGGAKQESLRGLPNLTDGLPYCDLGEKAASKLNIRRGDKLVLRNGSAEEVCSVRYLLSYGGQADNQIFVNIETAQHLAGLQGRISLIQASVPGKPQSIDHYIGMLARAIPNADVHGIRQFTEGEAKIYNRISGVLSASVVIVLVLTGLCVMAAMTNVAMERRNDVGLMKAIGGASRRVLRLFLAEAALLGLTGGLFGAAAGIALSIALGKAVFGMAARPRLIVYPVAVVLTIFVAIGGAYPLRRLKGIQPASIFRGEA